ncbi:hypothetical protein [Streptomyces sp. NBC_01361]|uniref:hypothetical protein n=1 Tax=Streptomyces sp. NBC_01361 TaxID=2903838 RepID=UPI002E315282|nr:hypothetical protein [Streptomyces sp. NBC_01361]
MKALLWLVLITALAVNVSTSFAFDGVPQVLISVGTGLAALACGATLFMLRRRDA